MRPVSPVIKGVAEVTYAKDQPQYIPLPAIRARDGMITTRWQCTWKERLAILLSGNLFLQVHTFGKKLQPVRLFTRTPNVKEVL